jgi:hypothetical protein
MATAAEILRIAARQAGWDLEEFDRRMEEVRADMVYEYVARKEIPRVEVSNPEQIRPFIQGNLRGAWRQGFDDGYRCAIGGARPPVPCTVHPNPYGED